MFRVYSLTDPRMGKVRYVGITECILSSRRNGHVHTPTSARVRSWVKELQQEGLQPRIELLEEHPDRQAARQAEHWWICHYFCANWPLLLNYYAKRGGVVRQAQMTTLTLVTLATDELF